MSDETRMLRKTPETFAYLFWLTGIRRGTHVPLLAEGNTIGRGGESDILLDDDAVSAEQARIRKEGDSWFLYDLAATNTTTVADGSAIYRHQLNDRDRITFGTTDMLFRVLA